MPPQGQAARSSDPLAATDARLPLYVRLREVLTRRVAAGEWPAGTPLPAETSLAETYGVSVGTMRKAVERLVDEGLLERRQGSGTYVRRARFDQSLFRFFRHAGAEEGAIPASRILRRAVEPANASAATALGLDPEARVIRVQRLRLWGDEPFLAEDILLPLPRFHALMTVAVEEFGPLLYPTYEAVCGQVVASARERLTVGLADTTTARLLRCPAGAPMVVVERLALAHDGTPLEWRRSRGRASDFVYQVEIR